MKLPKNSLLAQGFHPTWLLCFGYAKAFITAVSFATANTKIDFSISTILICVFEKPGTNAQSRESASAEGAPVL